jgi:hypothetical protein
MPEKMIAFCGIVCTDCRVLRASQADDTQLKKKVARAWSTKKETLRPDDIECDGCLPTGQRLFKFCGACDVRRCGQERGLGNCAYCSEFPCEKLTGLWKHLRLTGLRATLQEIRDGVGA